MGCGVAGNKVASEIRKIEKDDKGQKIPEEEKAAHVSEEINIGEFKRERERYDKKTKTLIKGFKLDKKPNSLEIETDLLMSMGQYFGTTIEPNNHPAVNPAEPSENYALEYVYGYRTTDCPHNLFFTADHKVVYNVATLGIVLDPKENTQSFFGGNKVANNPNLDQHDLDIMCLAISSDRKFIATGQLGEEPSLFVWEASSCKLKSSKSKYVIKEKNTKGICCCAWSGDNQYIAFVDMHEAHNLYVMDVESGEITFKNQLGAPEVFDISWNKGKEKNHFATCGIRNIKFWDIISKTSKLGTGAMGKTFFCVTYGVDGSCYAGGHDGKVYLFQNGDLKNCIQAHTGFIHCITWVDDKLLTGGQDNILNVYDTSLTKEGTVNLPSIPRAIDMHNNTILVGLKNGTIGFVSKGKLAQEIMKSHEEGEVWGLEVLDSGDIFTTGEDNKLILWNAKERKCKGEYMIGEITAVTKTQGKIYPDTLCSRLVCYNPIAKVVALATNTGVIQIREFTKLDTVTKFIPCGTSANIEWISFSPDGKFLAAGTHNNNIIVYNVETFSVKGTLKGHNNPIQAFDWSKDSKYIRSCDEKYEVMYFDIENMEKDKNGLTNTKDLEWQTLNIKIDWSLQGIYDKGIHGSQINCVVRSVNEKLVATGDEWGFINVYRAPCLQGHQGASYKAHSEHVKRIKFGMGDNYIFSVGGYDKTLMQWKKK